MPDADWGQVTRDSKLGYNGDVVERAQRLSWAQTLPSIPPKEHCASVPVEMICEGAMLEFV